MKPAIVGCGFVGGAIAFGYESRNIQVLKIDKKKELANAQYKHLEKADVIWVCLPTPMKYNGEIDLSVLNEGIKTINKYVKNKIIIIKSTILPGTTQGYADKYKDNFFIHSPEFLTAKNSKYDYLTAKRIVFGLTKTKNPLFKVKYVMGKMNELAKQLKTIQPKAEAILTTSYTSELAKDACNFMLAKDVETSNQIKKLADTCGANYEYIREIMGYDERIGKHTQVKHLGGYDGHCLPKDVSALAHFAKRRIKNNIFDYIDKKNRERRPELYPDENEKNQKKMEKQIKER